MITPIKGETRQEYLLRVAVEYIKANNLEEHSVGYDETSCDGYCLCDDIEAELSMSGISSDLLSS